MTEPVPGPLIIIGGHEDKVGDRAILSAIAAAVGAGRLVIATIASHEPEGYFPAYTAAFAPLGVTNLAEVYLEADEDTAAAAQAVAAAKALFFTGGDQRRLVDQVAGTPVEQEMRALHARGGLIAGTSAGASALGKVMITSGPDEETTDVGAMQMAAGFGLVPGVIIDQHFAERGRIGRLVAALARRPGLLGIGIDENTAVRIDAGWIEVLGSGNVTIICSAAATFRAAPPPDGVVSVRNLDVQVLAAGDRFEMPARNV